MIGANQEIHYEKSFGTNQFIKRLDTVYYKNIMIHEHYFDPQVDTG